MKNRNHIFLYGTGEPPETPRLLTAGPLSVELEDGNLRHVRYHGQEIMRAVSFIVRDRNWGTYRPTLKDLDVQQHADSFQISYQAEASDHSQRFDYSARITGTPAGLRFEARGEALSDFLTNRTGFVVLHPVDDVAGSPVSIERVDGSIEEGQFPVQIDPVQPMMELRTLTHEPLSGVRVCCRMEGDTYEMEDQRNWTDASYKTYVRPLARPWPYTVPQGEILEQVVSLTIEDSNSEDVSINASHNSVDIGMHVAEGRLPMVGVGLPCEEIPATRQALQALGELTLGHVIVHYDTSRGHTHAQLQEATALASKMAASVWLEVVVQEVERFEKELDELGRAVADMNSPFDTVLVSPAPDLNCTLPGSEWPPAPDATALYQATRRAFGNARIGGGMFSFFTELNRKRPPLDDLDLIGFTTSAIVHAGDDQTVMENLSSLPFIASTAREIAGRKPISVGPSAIGMRMNPYGDAPMENLTNIRQAMNRNDPRQRGLLGAAWAVGYHARLAAEVDFMAFGATTGAHGLLHTKEEWPQPWFDQHAGLFPQFHVVRALARLAGLPRRELTLSAPAEVQALAAETNGQTELLIANLTAGPVDVRLPQAIRHMAVLDSDTFETASTDVCFLDKLQAVEGKSLVLSAFAVARVIL